MKAIVQRVLQAQVQVDGKVVGCIEKGFLTYIGVGLNDKPASAEKLADKVGGLRIFEDGAGKMNLSLQDVGGDILAIPNFTLLADASQGRRPAFSAAAPSVSAEPVFAHFILSLRQMGLTVSSGMFGADMIITSKAEGPVNILLEA